MRPNRRPISFFVMLMSIGLIISCHVSKRQGEPYIIYPAKIVKNSKPWLVTSALPNWLYLYTEDSNIEDFGEKHSYGTASDFVFFNDSLFAGVDNKRIEPGKINNDKYLIVGRYKVLNDSLIRVIYTDGNKAPVIYLSHNYKHDDSIIVTIKRNLNSRNSKFSISRIIPTLRWQLKKNDSIVMPDRWAFSQEQRTMWSSLYSDSAYFSAKIGAEEPDNITFNTVSYISGLSKDKQKKDRIQSHITIVDSVAVNYQVNIVLPSQNYLTVVDLRDPLKKECKVNKLDIVYDGDGITVGPRRWYPDTLIFKKKVGKLILLNKDGSESKIEIKIH